MDYEIAYNYPCPIDAASDTPEDNVLDKLYGGDIVIYANTCVSILPYLMKVSSFQITYLIQFWPKSLL